MLVQWLALPWPLHGDPLLVFQYASTWPDVPLSHHALRIGLLIPSRVAQELLGFNQASYVITALGLGAVGAVGTYAAGRVLMGQAVGVVAAVLLITNPIFAASNLDPRDVWPVGRVLALVG